MPRLDGTGPAGMGPMTGGARGLCNPYSSTYPGNGPYRAPHFRTVRPYYGRCPPLCGFNRPLWGLRRGWGGRGRGGWGRGRGYW